MNKRKAPINMLSRSKAPKAQQIADYKHKRKISRGFFYGTARAFTFALAII